MTEPPFTATVYGTPLAAAQAENAWLRQRLQESCDFAEVAHGTAAMAIASATQLKEQLDALDGALQPFALIASEGVITAKEGHVTVTTCAEYFHRAADALARSKS